MVSKRIRIPLDESGLLNRLLQIRNQFVWNQDLFNIDIHWNLPNQTE